MILGDNPPTAAHGLIGDRFQLKSNPNQAWRCTVVGFYHEWNKYNYWATWE